jgi:N-acetylglutamate synthase-like GNAT family acetyltransferase
MSEFEIRPLDNNDRNWVAAFLDEHWGSTRVVSRGTVHLAHLLPGFAAFQDAKPVGLLIYQLSEQETRSVEIVTLNSVTPCTGIGTALVTTVCEAARAAGCKRLWLVTTNDNLNALRFYQKRGFALVAIHRNALEETRKLKPQIPLVGLDGIPLRDEIELEMKL